MTGPDKLIYLDHSATTAVREDKMGRQMVVKDMNQDGLPDLLVGAESADLNGASSGAIFMSVGVEGAW